MKIKLIITLFFTANFALASIDSKFSKTTEEVGYDLCCEYKGTPVYVSYSDHEKIHISKKTQYLVKNYIFKKRPFIPDSSKLILALVPENPNKPLTKNNITIGYSTNGKKLKYLNS